MRAFIFSLDAFIAFTLALVAIYSLIFFSSVPSSYYYLLTQVHFLSKDALYAISTADCAANSPFNCGSMPAGKEYTVLERMLFPAAGTAQEQTFREALVEQTIGKTIPAQFGYRLERSDDNGTVWTTVYDSGKHPETGRPAAMRKLEVSSEAIAFDYGSGLLKPKKSPYNYNTCSGDRGLLVCYKGSELGSDLVPQIKLVLIRLKVYI